MTTGKLIKEARKNAGITQSALGEKLGVSTSFIAQYETGKRNPKYDTIRRIAAALGVEWTDLVPEGEQGPMVINHIREGLSDALSTPLERVTRDMNQMNLEGQTKVADYAADILPRYRRQDAPSQDTPAEELPTEGE